MFMIPVLIGVTLFAHTDKIVPRVRNEVYKVRSKIAHRRYLKDVKRGRVK